MRRLDEHLSPHELADLSESPEAVAAGETHQHELLQHLQHCEACADLAQTHWHLRSLFPFNSAAAGGAACPSQTIWLEFAEGLRPEESALLLAHAAGCTDCALLLREAMEFTQPDKFEQPIVGLASATPAWQRRVAEQMVEVASSPSQPSTRLTPLKRLRTQRPWFMLSVAAALLLAAVIPSFIAWRSSQSESHLLARAYNKQRTMALRIPGGDPVAMASITRGSSTGLAEPTELLELRLRTQKHLEDMPNSAYWHQVLGETQLLEVDGSGARRNLEIAQTVNDKLPHLQADLAAAWFEIGEKTGSAEAYAQAAELYSKEIQQGANDKSILFYNRALCWERQGLKENALDDLHQALLLERSEQWQKAIKVEIQKLSGQASSSTKGDNLNASLQADGYETQLAEATERLLPRWNTSAEVRRTFAQLATVGVRHNDRWLLDWIEANHSATVQEADRHLSLAAAAGSAGEAETSLVESRRAIALYVASDQTPGRLRAQLAEIYALQRLGRSKECLELTRKLATEPRVKVYAWMQTQLALEKGNCSSFIGDLGAEQSNFERALRLSRISDFPILYLRALGARASLLNFRGTPSAAWQLDVSGLQLCSQLRCPPIHQYKFLYNVVTGAKDLELHHVAAEVMRIAEHVASTSGDATTQAYSLETLATLIGHTGDFAASARAFTAASTLANSGNRAALAKLYQAEWQTDRADILARQGYPQRSLTLLQQSAPAILDSDYQAGRVSYYTQLSVAQLALGHDDEALASASTAVRESEHSLSGLHSTLAREQWSREHAATYAELVKVHLQRGEDTAALQVWERFRSAPYTTALKPVATSAFLDLSRRTKSLPLNTQVVVLARIDETYVGWLALAQPLQALRTVVLGDRSHLHQSSTTFYRLCADRDSNLGDVKVLGARLYAALLEPLTDQLGGSHRLWIDLDPSLAMLPLSALTLPDGTWVGDASQIAVMPAWWSLHPATALASSFVTPAMHMVVVSGFGNANRDVTSEASEVARLFPHSVLIDGDSASPQTVLRSLASAEVFHFSGHARLDNGSHLLLAPTDQDSEPSAMSRSLSPESIGSVHLRGCRVAVLAACNTTAADPDQLEKLPDLRNALLLSGAYSVIASNWDVDDRSTGSLMLAFYKQLILGLSPAQALQSAQRSVRSTNAWQHPYYWASFETFAN